MDGDTVNGFTPVKGDQVIKQLGITGVNPQNLSAMGFPIMAISGYSNIAIQAGGITNDDRDWGFADTLTWAKGRHVLKMGGEYKPQSSYSALVPDGSYGSFTFNGSLSGFSYADFLLGLPYQSSRLNPIDRAHEDRQRAGHVRAGRLQGFQAPDARSGPALGSLRAEQLQGWADLQLGPEDRQRDRPAERIEQDQPALSDQHDQCGRGQCAGIAVAAQLRSAAWLRLPALGEKTVFRGSYGIFTETLGRFARDLTNGPYQISESFFNAIQNGQPLFAFPNPFPAGAGTVASQSITGYPTDTNNGKIHQFNFSIERQIKDIGIRLSYVGARDRGMNYNINIDKPMAEPDSLHAKPPALYAIRGRHVRPQQRGAELQRIHRRRPPQNGPGHFRRALDLDFELSELSECRGPVRAAAVEPRSVFVEVPRRDERGLDHAVRTRKEVPDQRACARSISRWEAGRRTGSRSWRPASSSRPAISGSDPSNTNTSAAFPTASATAICRPDQRTSGALVRCLGLRRADARPLRQRLAVLAGGPGFTCTT